MGFPDLRTVYLAGLLMILLSIGITVPVWRRNRGRFSGLGLWVTGFSFQGIASLLVFLRGTISDLFSVLISGVLMVSGLWLGLTALQRFFGVSRRQWKNAGLLIVFGALHGWFLWARPSLVVRSVNLMVLFLAFFGQILLLLVRTVRPEQRRIARPVGIVTALFAATAFVRIGELVSGDTTRSDFFSSGGIETYTILLMFGFFTLLAFSVVHMVNNQLITSLTDEEAEVHRLLEEKELILREVHHRIKNNIAVAASLLHLQSREQLAPESQTALTAAADRLRGMSILYDKLYRSSGGISFSLKEYLTSIVEEIVAVHPELENVAVRTEFEEAELNSRLLSSVGIVCCELITNSMKHAFTDHPVSGDLPGQAVGDAAQPEIAVSGRIGNGSLVLRYEDNGSGMRDVTAMDGQSGFGLTMIHTLAAQIRGVLEITTPSGGGTRVDLTVPI